MSTKAIRQALGLTQKAFAARLRVSVLTVKWWEAGTRSPSRAHQDQIVTMMQDAQQERLETPSPTAAAAQSPPAASVPPSGERQRLTLGEAVRRMGLKDEGHGRRSDHTIRKAIKLKRLHAWKAPGKYRAAVAEWCFYADDFERWRATHYQAHRDPRRNT